MLPLSSLAGTCTATIGFKVVKVVEFLKVVEFEVN